MSLLNSIVTLVDEFVNVSRMSVPTVTKWMRGKSTESERQIESGQSESDDWSEDFQILFNDFVETII